jgi:acyl-CoA synthetase (AMP-forming)/AMP-acid ligase II
MASVPATMNAFVNKTYAESLALLAERFGDRTALVVGDRRYAFADLRREADGASARFLALGLQPGDKVALWMPNSPEYLWCWLGAAQIGLVAVMLNTRLRIDEVAYQIRQSDSRAVIVPAESEGRDFLGDLAGLCPEIVDGSPGHLQCAALPELRWVLTRGPSSRYRGTTAWAPADVPSQGLPYVRSPDVPALIAYSSGTTALPKGAVLTHHVWRKAADHGDRFAQTADDRLYLCVPLFGILANVNGALTFWSRGSCVVLAGRFEAGAALQAIQDERCTAMYLLPVMVQQMLAHPDRARLDTSTLRTGIVVTMDSEIVRAAVTGLGMRELFTSYGLTETSSAVTRTFGSDSLEHRLSTHGPPLPDIDVRIADPATNAPLASGETGEIQVKGYCLMLGYYKMPEATAAAFTADGWYKTGDLGAIPADGSLRFTARLKDVFKHKGFNVSAAEVEEALAKHPAVSAAAVVGLPHATFGEVGAAFVTMRAGKAISQAELVDFVRPQLATYKLPSHVFVLDELPVTAGTGKVQKHRLREYALSRLEAAGVHN